MISSGGPETGITRANQAVPAMAVRGAGHCCCPARGRHVLGRETMVPDIKLSSGGFSFLELFMTAHPVVKFVMFGLLLASIWAWAIIIEKLFAFRRARREADRFEQLFWSGQSLEELYAAISRARTFSMASLFVAAMREWKRSVEGNIRALGGIQLRVEKVMDVTISREMEQLDRRLLFLATVGSCCRSGGYAAPGALMPPHYLAV